MSGGAEGRPMANRGTLGRLRSIGGHCGGRGRWPLAYTGEPSDSENLLSMALGLHPLQLRGQTSRVYACLCVRMCVVRGHAPVRLYPCVYVCVCIHARMCMQTHGLRVRVRYVCAYMPGRMTGDG
jgi:hypothetical protein